jgi:hypothetical protein
MNHWESVVSAELSRQHKRRKEISARELGTRLGKDRSITATSQASGTEGHHVVNGVRKMRNAFSRWLDSL